MDSLFTQRKIVLLIAVGLDLLLGDPPNRFHPVAWMGSLIQAMKRSRLYGQPRGELLYGGGMVVLGASLVAVSGYTLQVLIRRLPTPLRLAGEALALKTLLAVRGLDRAAAQVGSALENEDLPEARRLVAWHLVSRDTRSLDEAQVSAAAIESVAENASDSVIAPLFYYLLGGLPAAFVYRFANTADAMLGYRDERYEWLGKVPARLDDLLNFVPARLTAGLIVLASGLTGLPPRRSLETVRGDAGKTASPNAGYPMSAMAGALGVALEKEGHYELGSGFRKPVPADLHMARRVMLAATGLGVLLALLIPCGKKRVSL